MHEANRRRLIASLLDHAHKPRDLGILQRLQNRPVRRHPLGGHMTMLARHQGLRQDQVQVVLLEPVLRAHLDYVAKAFRRDEGGLRPPPLDQRIGDQRGAVNDLPDFGKGNTRPLRGQPDSLQDRRLRRGVIGQDLARRQPARMLQSHIRERAPDIHTNPNTTHQRLLHSCVAANAAR